MQCESHTETNANILYGWSTGGGAPTDKFGERKASCVLKSGRGGLSRKTWGSIVFLKSNNKPVSATPVRGNTKGVCKTRSLERVSSPMAALLEDIDPTEFTV